METTSNTKRFLNWGIFIVIIGLVIWGLVAAQQKANKEEQNLILPTEITAEDHFRGNATAPVTLVEYGDFQCPACRSYYPIVEELIKAKGPDALRFVSRHYPLSQHANAMSAAQAAEAAGLQGKFWEMYGMLYEKQPEWEQSTSTKIIFTGYAKEMGLDEKKFSDDYELKSIKDLINNQYKGGVKAGINSTPTFFVNGIKIKSPQNYDEFKKVIDDSLPKLSF